MWVQGEPRRSAKSPQAARGVGKNQGVGLGLVREQEDDSLHCGSHRLVGLLGWP